MRILYVDDNPDLRAHAEVKLRGHGHIVFTADSYEAASVVLRDPASKVQVVIADHMLAGSDGFNFVLGLQQAFPNLQVCVLAQELTRSEANQMTMSGIRYFKKPVLLENVLKTIRAAPPVVAKKVTKRAKAEGLLGQAGEPKANFFQRLFSGRRSADEETQEAKEANEPAARKAGS